VSPRVLRDPAPSVALSAFGADGLEFTIGFWIVDPENGVLSLRSEINLAVLRALRAHGIDIPYPQRVVHWAADGAGGGVIGEPVAKPPSGAAAAPRA